jgi:hypothetical protein
MSSTKNRKPKFGAPVADLPETLGGPNRGAAPYWTEVAQHVQSNPGVWHPVRLDHLTIKGHASAAQRINAATRDSASKTSKNPAFLAPGYQAAFREGVLYVRYDAPKVSRIGKRAAS